MKKLILLSILIFTIIQVNGQELKDKLVASYKAFYHVVKTKDTEKLKSSISSSAYMSIKNQMLSAGAKFPDDFFNGIGEVLPDIDKLKYIKSISNGPTAFGIFSGKDPYGSTTLYVLKFLEENKEWKFNLLDEKSSEELSKSIAAGNFDFLSDKKYQPDGIIPVTPAEIIQGDYKAMIDISGYGYEVEITINGNLQKRTNGGSYSGIIVGGIKKGTNKIVIAANPKKGEEASDLSVSIRALINKEQKDVFSLEEKSPAATITKEFVVQ